MDLNGAGKVTAISVFHDRAELVEASVGSLVDQTLDDLEILLVDDGSTDDTLERLRGFQDRRITVLTHENMGFTKAIKAAVARAGGDYIAIHGSGDLSRPARLERQRALLEERPDIGMVNCAHLYKGKRIGPETLDIVEPGEALERFRTKNPFVHGAAMFRKSLYDEVGGYDEAFKYGQDADLWLRMSPLCRFAILPDILYERMDPENSVTRSAFKFYEQQKLGQAQLHRAERASGGGADPANRNVAARLAEIDLEFARRFYDRGVGALMSRDYRGARFVLRKAWEERRDGRGVKALALWSLCCLPIGGPLAFNVMRVKRRLLPKRD